MYIMSQDGTRLEKLVALAVIHNGPHTSPYRIEHYVTDDPGVCVAAYPTEPEAKAQLAGIAAALLRGSPIYCFD
jgi:hypothetical protein